MASDVVTGAGLIDSGSGQFRHKHPIEEVAMPERRWHIVPATASLCWLWLGVGAVLLVSSILTLTGTDGRAPVLTVIAAVAAVALMALSVAGLARPRLRGR